MECMEGRLCPLDGTVEDQAHVLKHCFFSAFMFDTTRRVFGQCEVRQVKPSRLNKC